MTAARISKAGVYIPEVGRDVTSWVGECYETQGEAQDGLIDFISRNGIPSEWIRSFNVEYFDQNHIDWVEGTDTGWRPTIDFYDLDEVRIRQGVTEPPEKQVAGFPWWILLALLPFL